MSIICLYVAIICAYISFNNFSYLRNISWQKWFVGLLISSVLDGATTYLLLLRPEVHEGYSAANYIFAKVGVLNGIFLQGGFFIVVALILGVKWGKTEKIRYLIFITFSVHLFAAMINGVYLCC